MTKLGELFATLSAVTLLIGCASTAPNTSSDTHILVCRTDSDCGKVGHYACVAEVCKPTTTTSDGSSGTSPTACNPLAPATTSVTIDPSTIVDAGRDSDGTVYVLTETNSEMRLFVSNGSLLTERWELGTGEGTTAGVQFWTFEFNDDAGTTVTVEVQKDASGPRMGVVKGPIPGKGFDVGSMGDVLTPIDAKTAAAMPAQSTQTFHVDYSGALTDGRNVVVTAPDHATNYDGFRMFFGKVGALDEQAVTMVTRTLGIPSTTEITLTISGSVASLSYGQDGTGTLSIGIEMDALTGPMTPAVPPGASFVCQ